MAIFIPTKPQLWPDRLDQIYTDIVGAYQRDQRSVSVERMKKWYGAHNLKGEFQQFLSILSNLNLIKVDQYGGYKPLDDKRSFRDSALDHFLNTDHLSDQALLTIHISLNMLFSTGRKIEEVLIPSRMNEILGLGSDDGQYRLAMRWLKFLDLGVSVPAPNLPTQIIIPTYTKVLLDALRRSELLQNQNTVDLYVLINSLRQTLAIIDGSEHFNDTRKKLKKKFQASTVIQSDLDQVGVRFDGVGSEENILSYGLAYSLLMLQKQGKIKLITTADFRGHDEIVKLPLPLVSYRERIQGEELSRPKEIHQIMLIEQTGGEL